MSISRQPLSKTRQRPTMPAKRRYKQRMGFVEQPQVIWWRATIFQLHLWTGVILGLYVIAISVSGSVLVFERDLMNDAPRLAPRPQDGTRIDYQALVQIANRLHPREILGAIDMRTGNRSVVTVALQSTVALQGKVQRHRNVYVDAHTGRILADTVVEEKHALLNFLERLHNKLLGGETGEAFNGVGGGLLFFMSLTGIIIWWPGRKNWTRAIKVKWNARWARLIFDLHSAFGFWALVFVAMWGFSALYFAFPQAFSSAFGLFSPVTQQRQSNWSPGQRLLGIDAYLNRAQQVYPGSMLAYLYMDVYRPAGQVSVFLSRDPKVPMTLLEDIVRLDPATGAVLATESSRRWSPAEKIAMASYSIHFGDFGGTWSKVAWVMLGLAPAALAVTGYLMWWNRVLSKKWAALRRAGTQRSRVVASTAHA